MTASNSSLRASPPVTVRVDGHPALSVAVGTPVGDLPGVRAGEGPLAYLGALVNNDLVTLSYPLEVDSQVELLTITHPLGWRIYRNTAAFLLAKTVHELFPDARFAVEHSLGTGFYCSFTLNGENGIGAEPLGALEAAMRALIARDAPIVRRKTAFADAMRGFEEQGLLDKFNLLRFRNPPKVVLYACEKFADLAHHVLADHTGAIPHFALIPYPPGFVLQFPEREKAPEIAPFDPQPHLFQIFREHKECGRILGMKTVGDLNLLIADGTMAEVVRTAEAIQEKNISRIADEILARRDRVRCVLIAGPSSAGKTTFSKRLSVQLRVNGLQPVGISVDDYFVNRDQTPRDETGDFDFEHIETVDLDLFNNHLAALDRGEEIEQPSFNFEKGEREYRGRRLRIEPGQLLVVEGIHCLNPRLTAALPAPHKFLIYISALTGLNLDYHNRIATTDNRLLRRMVRDHLFRGNDALTTLSMWPSVRRGEKRWIFPFQKEADVAFNSALDYELAVLKPLAEPLLKEVKPYHAAYAEARRLLAFLDSFLTLSFSVVPPNSILREFIGRSAFRYD